MRVAILDDYFDTLRTLDCFRLLDGHDVTVWTDHVQDVDTLAGRLADTEALVLIRERTSIDAALLDRLPELRLISQRSVYPHIDVDACTRLGIIVSSDLHQGTPSFATAELTWASCSPPCDGSPSRWRRSGPAVGRRAWGGRSAAGRSACSATAGSPASWPATPGPSTCRSWCGRGRTHSPGQPTTASRQRHRRRRSSSAATSCRCTCGWCRRPGGSSPRTTSPGCVPRRCSSTQVEPASSTGAHWRPRSPPAGPGMAAVDVFDEEPLRDVDDPLLRLDQVVCTPHIGYVTRDEWELQFADIFGQIVAFAAGSPSNVVNPDVLARRRPPPLD